MKEHTAGPWEYYTSYDGLGDSPIGPCPHCGREDMAYISIPGGHGDGECAMYTVPDAQLIAAAPETKAQRDALLVACKAALAYDQSIVGRAARGEVDLLRRGGGISYGCDLDGLYDDWISKAKAAIAMTKGETP